MTSTLALTPPIFSHIQLHDKSTITSPNIKMFKRLWTGLPPDPEFPSDLKELGYVLPGVGVLSQLMD